MRIHNKIKRIQTILIDAKSKIFYSTTIESFGNRIERSRAMLLRLVQLDQSLAYIKLIIG